MPFELHGLTAGDVSQGHRFLGGPGHDRRSPADYDDGAAGRRRGRRATRPAGRGIVAGLDAAAGRGRRRVERPGRQARGGRLPGRVAERHHRALRRPPPAAAAAGAGDGDAGPPALLPARDGAGGLLPAFLAVSQRRPGPRRRHHPRQRGRARRPAAGRRVQLRPRPRGRPGGPRRPPRRDRLPQAPRHHGPEARPPRSPGSRDLADARRRRRRDVRDRRPSTPPAWRRPTRAPCWWPSSPSSRATSPPSTPAARASPTTVATAVEEQYLPEGPDSPLPSGEAGALVAAAEKFDNLVGAFAVDEAPDRLEGPLRPAPRRDRAGADRPRPRLGRRPVRRSCVAAHERLARAGRRPRPRRRRAPRRQVDAVPGRPPRLPARPRRGSGPEAVAAAIGAGPRTARPSIAAWARAIDAERGTPEWAAAWTAATRLARIARKGPAEDEPPAPPATTRARRALRDAIAAARARHRRGARGARPAGGARPPPAPLAEAVDRFFVDVLVNADDPGVRARRYALVREAAEALSRRGGLRAGHRRRRERGEQRPGWAPSGSTTSPRASRDMRDLLGGKGANVAEMTRLGLPVPKGFTITTETCIEYLRRRPRVPGGPDARGHRAPRGARGGRRQAARRRPRTRSSSRCAAAPSSRCPG